MLPRRGDIYYARLNEPSSDSSIQGGTRPVLIIQNNKGNKVSSTCIVICITSKVSLKSILPLHYIIPKEVGLRENSIVLCEQITTIDMDQLSEKIGCLNKQEMKAVEKRILLSLGMSRNYKYMKIIK